MYLYILPYHIRILIMYFISGGYNINIQHRWEYYYHAMYLVSTTYSSYHIGILINVLQIGYTTQPCYVPVYPSIILYTKVYFISGGYNIHGNTTLCTLYIGRMVTCTLCILITTDYLNNTMCNAM